MQVPPCDRHGNHFLIVEIGKLLMVKLSRLSQIRENRESFPPRMFCRIRYVAWRFTHASTGTKTKKLAKFFNHKNEFVKYMSTKPI